MWNTVSHHLWIVEYVTNYVKHCVTFRLRLFAIGELRNMPTYELTLWLCLSTIGELCTVTISVKLYYCIRTPDNCTAPSHCILKPDTCTAPNHCILTPDTCIAHIHCIVTPHSCSSHSHCILTPVLSTVAVYLQVTPVLPTVAVSYTSHLYCPVTVYLHLIPVLPSHCILTPHTCTAPIFTPHTSPPTVAVYLHLTSIVTVLCWSLPSTSQLYSPETLQRTGLMLWTNVDNRLSAVSIVWRGSSPSFRMWILLWGLPSCQSQRTWTPGSLFSST